MFDSFMRVVCDKKMVATANEAELTTENGCTRKTFKETTKCFFTKSSKALAAMNTCMLLEVRFSTSRG